MTSHPIMTLDQWTDEQEIALLKAVVRWKPAGTCSRPSRSTLNMFDPTVGMHKHFRMLAIHNYMTQQGVVNPEDEHTRIPGIWEKLGSLYNLPILDEREDLIMNDLPDDNGNVAELYCPFSLPEEEYGDMMFAKRLKPDGSSSPAAEWSMHESTMGGVDEPGSSPAPSRRSGRAAQTPAHGRRVSKLQSEVESSRRTSKASSVQASIQEDDAGEQDEAESEEEEDATEDEEEARPRKVPKRGNARRKGVTSRRAAKR